jgi:hypothetical protein
LLSHRPRCLDGGLPPATRPLVHQRQLLRELAVTASAPATAPRPSAAAPGTPAVTAPTAHPAPATAGGTGGATTVRGRVRDSVGAPVPHAALALTDEEGRQLGRATARPDGAFRIDVPAPGDYLLIGSAPAHRPRAVTVAAGGPSRDVTLVLDRLGVLTGTVRDADGTAPVPGAALTVTDADGRTAACGRTAADGGFRFTGLAPGTYRMEARAAGHDVTTVPVRVAGGEPEPHDVRLAPGLRIGGTVRGRGGAPVREARVTLLDAAGTPVASATTGPDGRYGLPRLSPGDYTLVARGHFPASASVTVPAGGHAVVDLALSHPAHRAGAGTASAVAPPRAR